MVFSFISILNRKRVEGEGRGRRERKAKRGIDFTQLLVLNLRYENWRTPPLGAVGEIEIERNREKMKEMGKRKKEHGKVGASEIKKKIDIRHGQDSCIPYAIGAKHHLKK